MKDELISGSFDSLLDQAWKTAALYLIEAKRAIDSQFGDGYAGKNPDLVAKFMEVSCSEFRNIFLAQSHASVRRIRSPTGLVKSRLL